jgi:hypothetical protein
VFEDHRQRVTAIPPRSTSIRHIIRLIAPCTTKAPVTLAACIASARTPQREPVMSARSTRVLERDTKRRLATPRARAGRSPRLWQSAWSISGNRSRAGRDADGALDRATSTAN